METIHTTVFAGLKVLDLSSILAGPLAGSFFAECGAEVIKIENKTTNGDTTRQWKLPTEDSNKTYSAYYTAANYGKKVILLNLKDSNDRLSLDTYIEWADIIISNFQKSVGENLNLTPNSLHEINPTAIIAQLSAYTYDDPRPGYDLVMQGETGWISMTGSDQDHLAKLPVAMIDIIASHQLKEGILIGLWKRLQTAKGSIIHVSLYSSAISALANQATNYLQVGHMPKPIGTLHPNIAPYGDIFFDMNGLRFLLAVGSDLQFEKLWKTLNLPTEKYFTFAFNSDRVQHRSQLIPLMQERLGVFKIVYLSELFAQINIPFCQIRNLSEVFAVSDTKAMLHTGLVDGDKVICIKNTAFTIHTP
jgi:crotonobetainyl-CoA:carnitine CoA-transferase CaiB-like acyl-CoA transferase